MSRDLFVRIMNVVEAHDDYFVRKRNAANTLGFRNIYEHSGAGGNIIQKHSGAGVNIIQKHSQQYQNIYDYAILALTITNRN